MILKVSRRRYRRLSGTNKPEHLIANGLYDRERRALVKGGHAEPTPEDTDRMAKAQSKRDRTKAARATAA